MFFFFIQLKADKYDTQKQNLISVISNGGWTSVHQDHYITVTLRYVSKGQLT